jgi:hypothetical protein
LGAHVFAVKSAIVILLFTKKQDASIFEYSIRICKLKVMDYLLSTDSGRQTGSDPELLKKIIDIFSGTNSAHIPSSM